MDFDILQGLREIAAEFLDESDFRYYEKLEQFHCTCPDEFQKGLVDRLTTAGWHLKQTVPNVRKDWSRLIFTYQPKPKPTP